MVKFNHADDAHRRELSRKLQLLMDVVEADSGQRPPHKEIAAEVEAQGASMSRPRWGYMLGGNGPAVRDPRLLRAGRILGCALVLVARRDRGPRPRRGAGQPLPAAATTTTHHEETP